MIADTIFAPSTAPGRVGVAVVRISGPAAGAALRAVGGIQLPPPRRATLRTLLDPRDGQAIDRGLLLWFPGPASFTGEDLGEMHLHGGRAVVAAALDALAGLPGLRPAAGGEFKRRVFEHGRRDLTAGAGLADTNPADHEAEHRQDHPQTGGTAQDRERR